MALQDLKATVEDFIDTYGQLEAIELSNIDDSTQESIYNVRIQRALDLAFSEVMSYDALCKFAGKYAIRLSLKRLMLIIARYYLDSIERREDVIVEYEKSMEFLEKCQEVSSKDSKIRASDAELEELGLLNYKNSGPRVSRGRIGFTEESLEYYRNQKLTW